MQVRISSPDLQLNNTNYQKLDKS